eukprot:GHVT01087473.1.p1 GENE.GHVT01087473.1~~GHVT01087473.1.p1  ORF type:complete len:220 (-),score=34.15 GHVT01087473.1:2236-2895(-)
MKAAVFVSSIFPTSVSSPPFRPNNYLPLFRRWFLANFVTNTPLCVSGAEQRLGMWTIELEGELYTAPGWKSVEFCGFDNDTFEFNSVPDVDDTKPKAKFHSVPPPSRTGMVALAKGKGQKGQAAKPGIVPHGRCRDHGHSNRKHLETNDGLVVADLGCDDQNAKVVTTKFAPNKACFSKFEKSNFENITSESNNVHPPSTGTHHNKEESQTNHCQEAAQ